ncbi:MAG: LemA family protein, partial [Rubrivivax sp.]|nr:LemA family protein [Rubrivivax sp.]
MSTGQWIVLAAAAVIVFWMVGGYNRLVAMRSTIGEACRQLDELLLRRTEA